jgi:hypothetical protein
MTSPPIGPGPTAETKSLVKNNVWKVYKAKEQCRFTFKSIERREKKIK